MRTAALGVRWILTCLQQKVQQELLLLLLMMQLKTVSAERSKLGAYPKPFRSHNQ